MLKEGWKCHQKLLNLLFRHPRVYRLQLYHPLLRVIIGRIPLISDMQLVPHRIRKHIVLLTKAVDDRHRLPLIPDRDPFYFRSHNLQILQIPGPQNLPPPVYLKGFLSLPCMGKKLCPDLLLGHIRVNLYFYREFYCTPPGSFTACFYYRGKPPQSLRN